jgi:hypothetical protein
MKREFFVPFLLYQFSILHFTILHVVESVFGVKTITFARTLNLKISCHIECTLHKIEVQSIVIGMCCDI